MTVNSSIESMHRFFKHSFLEKKASQILDLVFTVIEDYVDLTTYNNITKSMKGKSSKKLKSTFDNHKTALVSKNNYDILMVHAEEEINYQTLNNKNQENFTISFKKENEDDFCNFFCYDCKICICVATCTCADYCINGTFCKDIHLVIISQDTLEISSSKIMKNEIVSPNENFDNSFGDALECLKSKVKDSNFFVNSLTKENFYNKGEISGVSEKIEDLQQIFKNKQNFFVVEINKKRKIETQEKREKKKN